MSKATGRTMHGVTRAILICVGVAFVLLGGLFVAACIGTLAQGANAPAAAKVGVTVQVITTVIFSLVVVAGVFMIWVGARRSGGAAVATPQANRAFTAGEIVARAAGGLHDEALEIAPDLGREVPEKVFALVGAERESDSFHGAFRASHSDEQVSDDFGGARRAPSAAGGEFGSADSDLGQFIARCGPERNGLRYHYVSAGIYLAIGLGFTISLPFMELAIQPGLGVVIPTALGVAAAMLHLWTPFFGKPQTIELHEFGIVERLGDQSRRIEIATIEHLQVREFYEHRFADRTFLVKARIPGQRQLEFTTALRGDGELIVDYLASEVPRTEFVEFKL
jgi:hypothetical protein